MNHCVNVLLLLVVTSTVVRGGYVIDLTDATFKDAIAKNNNIMVAFYSPRCGYSRMLLPEYEKAAATLQYYSPSITVAKVFCNQKLEKENNPANILDTTI